MNSPHGSHAPALSSGESSPDIISLYQLFDKTAEAVAGPVMSFRRPGPAMREFYAVLSMPDSQPGRYPEQFDLLYIGQQDLTTGQLIPLKAPEVVATGAWFVETRAQQGRAADEILSSGDRPSHIPQA